MLDQKHEGEPKMRQYQSLAHTKWDCKYHVVFIPKYRKKVLYRDLRQHLGEIFHELAGYQECRIEEGHLMGDHVHMCVSILPKLAVSRAVGYLKGKSAIAIARRFGKKVRNFKGENFWARGFFVATVGLDEAVVRDYIRTQVERDRYFEQMSLLDR
jgi:putative transposase